MRTPPIAMRTFNATSIERVSGARLRVVELQIRLSAGSFGCATVFVLRISSRLWRYSALVPVGLLLPCLGPPRSLLYSRCTQEGYHLSHRKHTLLDLDLVSILHIYPNTSEGDPNVLPAINYEIIQKHLHKHWDIFTEYLHDDPLESCWCSL